MSDIIKIHHWDGYNEELERLKKHHRERLCDKIVDTEKKFCADRYSEGLGYEKLAGLGDKNYRSVRVDRNHRIILSHLGGTHDYYFLHVGDHGEAYDWAARHRCEINPETCTLQVYADCSDSVSVAPEGGGLFAGLKDRELKRLGVPETQLGFVRSISTVDGFDGAKGGLPRDAWNNLSLLLNGMPFKDVLENLKKGCGKSAVAEGGVDYSAAMQAPATRSCFAPMESDEDLRRAIEGPLEEWRTYLDPVQREIVERTYSGSAKVLGGAGTGKTVVAMHRAKFLASKCGRGEKVLVTTFTLNLAEDIKSNLRKICGGDEDEMGNIEVKGLYKWLEGFLERSCGKKILYDDNCKKDNKYKKVWEDAIEKSRVAAPHEASFYMAEWNLVCLPQDALTLEGYLVSSRAGRGIRLGRRQREEVWKVIEAYRAITEERGEMDREAATYEAIKFLRSEGRKPAYKHVIVDEGQDFNDNAYRLIRALAGDEHENDIFIVGDPRQRIYENPMTLSKCGIETRGRTEVLKINYRTTKNILEYASKFLDGMAFDDFDGGKEVSGEYHALNRGDAPTVENFKDAHEEFGYICNEIKSLREHGVRPEDICVVTRNKDTVKDYYKKLFDKAGIRTYMIKQDGDNRGYPGLRLATMRRVKGVEFRYVFVASVNEGEIPNFSSGDKSSPKAESEALDRERRILYVALTRAKDRVYVTSHGKPSEFLSGARPSETKADGASRDDT